ncbi:MAG: hypothetical protein ETSY1_19205 [Candidatus Entotheonella factor]|uniref:Uncharacterized protein n=1 Tax=Entotheonella factor TaxID=1429438 RepID=W4LLU7_ENTF1|nr:MAG: hypothetical protein ETSY1_19205 [Candidatus Entotheonella factor]
MILPCDALEMAVDITKEMKMEMSDDSKAIQLTLLITDCREV